MSFFSIFYFKCKFFFIYLKKETIYSFQKFYSVHKNKKSNDEVFVYFPSSYSIRFYCEDYGLEDEEKKLIYRQRRERIINIMYF